ncbi:hypothetical protein TorRG33x02_084710 [Trema orientale]|uniref:Uncharacterized protein n=1 Tax=Trema orientale TaxID=63057 RepID=A0A2P5FCX5_TREOI|nr:hypothetical protein TorRG33x02_084710 [Trema orientale]
MTVLFRRKEVLMVVFCSREEVLCLKMPNRSAGGVVPEEEGEGSSGDDGFSGELSDSDDEWSDGVHSDSDECS